MTASSSSSSSSPQQSSSSLNNKNGGIGKTTITSTVNNNNNPSIDTVNEKTDVNNNNTKKNNNNDKLNNWFLQSIIKYIMKNFNHNNNNIPHDDILNKNKFLDTTTTTVTNQLLGDVWDTSSSITSIKQPQRQIKLRSSLSSSLSKTETTMNSSAANEAYKNKKIHSKNIGSNDKIRLVIRNYTSIPLIMCWMSENCIPNHFYNIKPITNDIQQQQQQQQIISSSLEKEEQEVSSLQLVTTKDRVEHTCIGHAFVFATKYNCLDGKNNKSNKKTLHYNDVIGAYRPTSRTFLQPPSPKNNNNKDNDDNKDHEGSSVVVNSEEDDDDDNDDDEIYNSQQPIHIVTITRRLKANNNNNNNIEEGGESIICCGRGGNSKGTRSNNLLRNMIDRNRNKRKKFINTNNNSLSEEDEEEDDDNNKYEYIISVNIGKIDDTTPIDTTTKVYKKQNIGGWPLCMVEDNWYNNDIKLKLLIEEDLRSVCKLLPKKAKEQLIKNNTYIWINSSFTYGPKAMPITGHGLCYHPGKDWLIKNGCHVEKNLCIELYNTKEYKIDRKYWKSGGVFLHELSHAYHNKCLKDGYNNKEIKECYNLAMKDKLYDSVPVHTLYRPSPSRPSNNNNDNGNDIEEDDDDDDNNHDNYNYDKDCDDDDIINSLQVKSNIKRKAYACTDPMEYFAELSTSFLGGISSSSNKEDEEYNKWYPFNRYQLKNHDPRAYKLLKKLWGV